jgi:hypothetical protein
MDSNLVKFLGEFEKHKGEFIIVEYNTVERFVAIGSDIHDYYYITYDGRKLKWNTCVGPIFYLKNKIDDTNYNDLVRIARLNEWSEVLKNSDDKLLYDKYITELNTMSGSDDELLTELYLDIK